jgi:hypothetical protein
MRYYFGIIEVLADCRGFAMALNQTERADELARGRDRCTPDEALSVLAATRTDRADAAPEHGACKAP